MDDTQTNAEWDYVLQHPDEEDARKEIKWHFDPDNKNHIIFNEPVQFNADDSLFIDYIIGVDGGKVVSVYVYERGKKRLDKVKDG